MTYRFSGISMRILTTNVHPDMIRLFEEVIKYVDCSILAGIRTPQEQAKDVASGLSQTLASKHLAQADGLSHAIDAIPFPPRWDDKNWKTDLWYFGGFVLGIAAALGIPIRWGGDWKRDNDPENNGFEDLDHFELVTETPAQS